MSRSLYDGTIAVAWLHWLSPSSPRERGFTELEVPTLSSSRPQSMWEKMSCYPLIVPVTLTMCSLKFPLRLHRTTCCPRDRTTGCRLTTLILPVIIMMPFLKFLLLPRCATFKDSRLLDYVGRPRLSFHCVLDPCRAGQLDYIDPLPSDEWTLNYRPA